MQIQDPDFSFNHVELGNPRVSVVMNREQDDVRHTNAFRTSGHRPFLPFEGDGMFLCPDVIVKNRARDRRE